MQISLVDLVLERIAYFKLSLNFTLAAEWIIIVTLSVSICLSTADNPKFSSVISPEIGINFLKFEGCSFRSLSYN